MNWTIWLAIAAVSAVTAVILARRKNRSAVIWPVGAFLFPPALLPLFALAPLVENNTARLNRRFLGALASLLILFTAFALIRYGSLHPCDMYAYEVESELVAMGRNPGSLQDLEKLYRTLSYPEQCLLGVIQSYL